MAAIRPSVEWGSRRAFGVLDLIPRYHSYRQSVVEMVSRQVCGEVSSGKAAR